MIGQKIVQGLAIGFVVCLSAPQAHAITIHPDCKKMRDKIGCSCALANGGRIIPTPDGGSRWASAQGVNRGRPTNQAFTQCIINNGRR